MNKTNTHTPFMYNRGGEQILLFSRSVGKIYSIYKREKGIETKINIDGNVCSPSAYNDKLYACVFNEGVYELHAYNYETYEHLGKCIDDNQSYMTPSVSEYNGRLIMLFTQKKWYKTIKAYSDDGVRFEIDGECKIPTGIRPSIHKVTEDEYLVFHSCSHNGVKGVIYRTKDFINYELLKEIGEEVYKGMLYRGNIIYVYRERMGDTEYTEIRVKPVDLGEYGEYKREVVEL